jgi:hypothetical protein
MHLPAITRREHKVLPLRMFADQKRCIRGICTPTHGAVEQLLLLELGHERGNRFLDGRLGCIRVCIRWVLSMRSRYRNMFWCFRAGRLVHLEACETWELITDFDDAMLVGLKEEADIAVVDNWNILIASGFSLGELYVGIYPSLGHTLIVQVDERGTPCSSGEDDLISIIPCSVHGFDANADAFCEKGLPEGSCAVEAKLHALVAKVLADGVDRFCCRQPTAIFAIDSFPALDLVPVRGVAFVPESLLLSPTIRWWHLALHLRRGGLGMQMSNLRCLSRHEHNRATDMSVDQYCI